MLAISSDSHVDVCVIRIRLCAGDLELLLLCGRHDKYSGWKTKARINLWICAVRSDYLLFVRVYHHYFVCLIAILGTFLWICSDTPLGDDTQFWDSLISNIDYKNICENTENATVTFPCPTWRNRMLVMVTSREILAETA